MYLSIRNIDPELVAIINFFLQNKTIPSGMVWGLLMSVIQY